MSSLLPAENSGPSIPKPRKRHIWRWIGITAGVIVAALALTAYYVARHAEPILRQRVVDVLSTRFNTQAQLNALHIAALHGLQVSGDGLLIPAAKPDAPPLLSIDKFSFHIALDALLQKPLHIGTVRVQGMRLNLPPKGERNSLPRVGGQKMTVLIDKILVEDTVLTLGTNKPNKVPLAFSISHLVLTHIVPGEPMHFDAQLVNPKPLGNIDTQGEFGPWNGDSAGETPVKGHYSFSHADLSTIKGIGGMLSSTGEFSGVLNTIVVDGVTDTPDFYIDIGNHPLPLHTKFHAIVNGMTGDTVLQPVEATLAHSSFTVSGNVLRAVDATGHSISGHDINLQVDMTHAHIDDMLYLAVKTEPVLMTGALELHGKLHIPPGHESVSQKIAMQGKFNITGANFNNPKFQEKVDEMSLRAEGHPELSNPQGAQKNVVPSSITGEYTLGNRNIDFPQLNYQMPGAQVLLVGRYSMDGSVFNFHGMLRTKAKVSQMLTGTKAKIAILADPFFAKHGAGAEIPIQIDGTKSEPHFGINFKRHANDDVATPDTPVH